LVYFIDLFTQGILHSEQSDDFHQRLTNLKLYFLYSLYSNICRSLFEKDKVVFSMLLLCRLMEFYGELQKSYWRFLLTGGISLGEELPPLPKCQWLSLPAWGEICRLAKLEGFEHFEEKFADPETLRSFQEMYDSQDPHLVQVPYLSALNPFQQLLVLRCIRPDKMIPAI